MSVTFLTEHGSLPPLMVETETGAHSKALPTPSAWNITHAQWALIFPWPLKGQCLGAFLQLKERRKKRNALSAGFVIIPPVSLCSFGKTAETNPFIAGVCNCFPPFTSSNKMGEKGYHGDCGAIEPFYSTHRYLR